jgi:hypothetical protein
MIKHHKEESIFNERVLGVVSPEEAPHVNTTWRAPAQARRARVTRHYRQADGQIRLYGTPTNYCETIQAAIEYMISVYFRGVTEQQIYQEVRSRYGLSLSTIRLLLAQVSETMED